jgi:hypothetical protein
MRGQGRKGRVVIVLESWQYGGGKSWKVTTATVLELGDGGVWGLTGTVAMLRAEAEVRGRLEATRHGDALARPGDVTMRTVARVGVLWACLGALVLANVDVLSSQQVYGRDQ